MKISFQKYFVLALVVLISTLGIGLFAGSSPSPTPSPSSTPPPAPSPSFSPPSACSSPLPSPTPLSGTINEVPSVQYECVECTWIWFVSDSDEDPMLSRRRDLKRMHGHGTTESCRQCPLGTHTIMVNTDTACVNDGDLCGYRQISPKVEDPSGHCRTTVEERHLTNRNQLWKHLVCVCE